MENDSYERIVVAEEWKNICELKHKLLAVCGWGNFRKHLHTRTIMTNDDLTKHEYSCYMKLQLPTSILQSCNLAIRHEINLYTLVTKHFGPMGKYLMTKTHSKSIADFQSVKLCKKQYLDKVLGKDTYDLIKFRIGQNISPTAVTKNTVILFKYGQENHLMGAQYHNNKWYFIDSNAMQMDTEIQNIFGTEPIQYPSHVVNIPIYNTGHCTAWTLFFIELIINKGPIDYTHIPKYVFMQLFFNYCSSLRERY